MASADLFGRALPPADIADLPMMLRSSFALACTTVLVRGDGHQTLNPCIRSHILRCGRILGPRSGCEASIGSASRRKPRYRLPAPFALGGLHLFN